MLKTGVTARSRPSTRRSRYTLSMIDTIIQPATMLSRRGRGLLDSPPAPEYLREHAVRTSGTDASPSDGDGYIPLCVAENRLVWDLLEPKIVAPREVTHQALCYDAMIGSVGFREQLARFLGRRVFGRQVSPRDLAVLAGAGSVLELLFFALGDPGDGVLVPTPSYAGFWLDLQTRDELTVVPVHTSAEDGFRLTPTMLDHAMETAGRPIRALLYTNPDNPRGSVASPEELEAILGWGTTRGIHVVVDEIYALSVFGDTSFTSCAQLRSSLGPMLHIVWAFSKDFGASGLRCGVLVSESPQVMACVDGLAYWACCSGDTQALLGGLVSDDSWVEGYIAEMQQRLRGAYVKVSTALRTAEIPFSPAEAGFFVLCDLRRFLDEPSWQAEHLLWRRILDGAGVNLTPGAACRNGEPGFMRLCYAGVPTSIACEGIRRVGRVLNGL